MSTSRGPRGEGRRGPVLSHVWHLWLAFGGLVGVSVACTPAEPEVAPSDAAAALWRERCATCHGDQGAGDGAAGRALTPRPRDLRDRAWQEAITDAEIRQTILYGGASRGLSPAMAAHPDLRDRPAVTAALVAKIRGLGGDAAE